MKKFNKLSRAEMKAISGGTGGGGGTPGCSLTDVNYYYCCGYYGFSNPIGTMACPDALDQCWPLHVITTDPQGCPYITPPQ